MNPGNTGYRYKMGTILAIAPTEMTVVVALSCGHLKIWYPFGNRTPQEYAEALQTGINPFIVGKTRIRCTCEH